MKSSAPIAFSMAVVAASASAGSVDDNNAITAYSGGRFVLRQAASGECVVALQGAVTRDATPRFDDVIRKADGVRCNKPLILLLESPGGLVSDAIDLAERVRARGLRTVVRYRCASACSLIFLGGAERVLWGSRAAIGLHQASDYDCDRYGTSPGTHRMNDYLRDVVPANADRIIDIIGSTSCKSIEWIVGDRAIDLVRRSWKRPASTCSALKPIVVPSLSVRQATNSGA